MKPLKMVSWLASVAIAATGPASAVELDQRALQIWDKYVKNADSDVAGRLAAGRPFLWFDDLPRQQKQIQMGVVVVLPRTVHGLRSVPRGLIHDWIGSVFIPDTKLDKVLFVARDYARYQDFYKPVVASSKLIRCSAMERDFSMVWLHRAFFGTIAIESELRSHDYAIGNDKWYNIVTGTQIQEIQAFGQRDEHFLPPDQGNGFLWRVHSITKYEQRDGGTYVEFEGMALTRDIPLGIRWFVKPIVEQLSRMSIAMFLSKTCDAVNGNALPAGSANSCSTLAGQDSNSLHNTRGIR